MALRTMMLPTSLRTPARMESSRPTSTIDRHLGAPDEKGPKGLVDALDAWSPLARRGTPRREDTRR